MYRVRHTRDMTTNKSTEARIINLYDVLPTAWNEKYTAAGTFLVCIACGRKVSKTGECDGVHITWGGGGLLHPDDAAGEQDSMDYMGWFPVGAECIRKVPAEYRAANPYADKVRGV